MQLHCKIDDNCSRLNNLAKTLFINIVMEQVYVQNTVHEILTGCMSSVHLTHVNKGRRGGGFRMVV